MSSSDVTDVLYYANQPITDMSREELLDVIAKMYKWYVLPLKMREPVAVDNREITGMM